MGKRRNTTLVHYDPAWEDKALCGMQPEVHAPIVVTHNRDMVTCLDCTELTFVRMCRTCGGMGEHDWEVHSAELRASESGY